MSSNLRKQKSRKISGQYLALPGSVTCSNDFRGLSGTATKTLLMIATQYRGQNNGDLQATFTLAKTWGIGSQQTLSKGLKELLAARMIIRTREGMFLNPGRKCALYAITWQPIDTCKGKLDVKATTTPPRVFSMEKNNLLSTEIKPNQYIKQTDKKENTLAVPVHGYENYIHAGLYQ